MALTADVNYKRRGEQPTRNAFGAPPAAGVTIYRGALLAYKADGTVQPLQVAGSVAFAGIADRSSNTPGYPFVRDFVVPEKGTWGIPLVGATGANINAPVYATDDATLTLASTTGTVSHMQVGTLAGIDNGLTFINLLGS